MAVYFAPSRPLDRGASIRPTVRSMPIDLLRDGDQYVLSADLPGIDPSTVDVDIDGQLLSIRAERSARGTDGATWLTKERSAGSFRRQFTLGDSIDSAGISASYDNGVLTVTIPVSERAKPRKVAVTATGTTAAGSSTAESTDAERTDSVDTAPEAVAA